jgi:hypothetical protein
MLDYLVFHGFELTACGSIFLIVFAVARTADAAPFMAAVVAALPVAVAWAFLNGGARLFLGFF